MTDALFSTRWIHAFEEDTAEGEVYRPETDDIPLSRRPRRRLSFSANGSAQVLTAGPDDRPTETHAAWHRDGDDIVVRPTAAEGERTEPALRVSVRSPTRLVVSK